MNREQWIANVQQQAGLPDQDTAERTARAVLRTLSERIPAGLAEHLAAQLPDGLADAETPPPVTGDGTHRGPTVAEDFDLTAFAGRVAWRADTDTDTALRRAGAVFEVLDAAVSPELMGKLDRALPEDVRGLLPTDRARHETG